MNGFPSNCTIHILPGVYHTSGSGFHPSYALKSGQKVVGSGMDSTLIQLASNAPSGNCVMGSGWNGYVPGGIVVSDLTLDCHYIPGVSENVTYSGLDLNGTRLTASRVKVVNLAYLDTNANSEAWGIGFNSYYGAPFNSDGNIIEYCVVSNFVAGTGCSAIAFTGGSISGIMRSNRVCLQATNFPLNAFNGGNMHDVVIEGNFVNGATSGFYGDTGGYTNVLLVNNTFTNCRYGVFLTAVPRENLTFSNNTFALSDSGGTAFWFNPNTSFTNILIIGNRIRFGSHAPGSRFLYANNINGLKVEKNVIDPVLTNELSNCKNVSFSNNRDSKGNIIETLN